LKKASENSISPSRSSARNFLLNEMNSMRLHIDRSIGMISKIRDLLLSLETHILENTKMQKIHDRMVYMKLYESIEPNTDMNGWNRSRIMKVNISMIIFKVNVS